MDDLDDVYAALAEAIDRHGAEKEAMFLAKACLLLAHEIGDQAKVMTLIDAAGANMCAMRTGDLKTPTE